LEQQTYRSIIMDRVNKLIYTVILCTFISIQAEAGTINIVLLGEAAVGKSELGNYLLNLSKGSEEFFEGTVILLTIIL